MSHPNPQPAREQPPALRSRGRTSGIRVICMDCPLDLIWIPAGEADQHDHDTETDHEVKYEGQYDRAATSGCNLGGDRDE